MDTVGDALTPAQQRSEKALHLFELGYNCAQAVLCAYEDLLPLPSHALKALACPFGGGMRHGSVCGTVTGALMALGLLSKPYAQDEAAHKTMCAHLTTAFVTSFKARQGQLNCRDLLGYDVLNPQEVLKNAHIKKQTCPQLVQAAVLLLEEKLLAFAHQ